MSGAAKNFLKQYGTVGIGVYGGVTAVNMAAIYASLRMGGDAVLIDPLERILGSDSETVQKIKQQLSQANDSSNQNGHSKGINRVREGTYFGIATAVDSLVSPIKLALCLPIARAILKRRGR